MLNTEGLTEQERLTLLDAIGAYRSVRTQDRPWMHLRHDDRMSPTELDELARTLRKAARLKLADLDDRQRFFYDHAGWSHDPKIETSEDGHVRCAVLLASAERHAEASGWDVVTEQDPDGPMADDAGSVEAVEAGECVCLIVSLRDEEGALLTSLGNCIVSSDSDDYVRVIGAELASEARTATATLPEIGA